jgi:hypothetical protein
MKLLAAIMMAIIGLVGWSTASRADEAFFYYGTTTGGPQFNRPDETFPFTPTGTIVSYQSQGFQVNQQTTCIVTSVQNGLFDGFLHIYQGAFNPLVSQNGVIAANDDDNLGLGVGSSRVVPPFTAFANTPYFVVTSAFAQQRDGDFQNTISCDSQGLPIPLVIAHGAGSSLGTTRTLLINDRFQVSATFFTAPGGPTSNAHIVQFGSDNSALFSFFGPQNWELLVKVLNFCSPPDNAYRVFAAGTTTVGVTVTVIDQLRGGIATISNPLNSSFQNQVVPIAGSCP